MSAAPAFRSDQVTEDYVSSDLSLRDVPLPVTLQLANPLSDENLLAFCESNSGLDIESDADGSIRIMTPAGPESSRLNQILAAELLSWARRGANGEVFGPDLGIRFSDKVMRGPDAAWLSADRWNAYMQTTRDRPGFLPFCPEFVVELRSRSDRASKIEAKMEFWMSRGAQLGWLIDPLRKLAMIYRPEREPEILTQPNTMFGDGPLAGFQIEMNEFWK
ncbi:MAG: Uma2 family endonuclease [Acidobacteriaceae bacterium]